MTIKPRDLQPRVVEAPRDLRTAIRKDAAALATWKRWSFTHQREMVDWITSAKKPETRTRRVEKAVSMLKTR